MTRQAGRWSWKRVTDSARKDSVRNLNKERVLLDHLTRFAPHENIIKTVRCSTLGEDVLVLEHGGANLVEHAGGHARQGRLAELDMSNKLRIGRQMVFQRWRICTPTTCAIAISRSTT